MHDVAARSPRATKKTCSGGSQGPTLFLFDGDSWETRKADHRSSMDGAFRIAKLSLRQITYSQCFAAYFRTSPRYPLLHQLPPVTWLLARTLQLHASHFSLLLVLWRCVAVFCAVCLGHGVESSFVRSLEGRQLAGSQLDLFIGSMLIAICFVRCSERSPRSLTFHSALACWQRLSTPPRLHRSPPALDGEAFPASLVTHVALVFSRGQRECHIAEHLVER
ncbi:hypothetical protein BDY17DRAFT_301164 [Neohortaea acidophila]|uniref:Uncharacterized protein n=1 Tax=Neohortaea acidophila TaxID=245834 RepID=A0A6A6PMM9_9PEZI|nr:uncharacterized protein BDY17DRAFT_301164 [Neohortaea acidophila]KAF2481340.1 hypothetical protein BDY17DRAFT_301164 [Neohortaea acidophila]